MSTVERLDRRTPPSGTSFTPARVAALAVIVLLTTGLGYMRFAPQAPMVVPTGAEAGDLTEFAACDGIGSDSECATIVVQENRSDSNSRLIALPVTRIPARASSDTAPIFYQQGGPGVPNEVDPLVVERLSADHDVVFVGFRGVEGSSILSCPEVSSAMGASHRLASESSLERSASAFASCAERLTGEGVDLDGYTLPERADDVEAVRVALGYDRINLLSESAGTRTAMIYAWRYPESVNRSVILAANPPGNYIWNMGTTDDQIDYYSELCARDESCRSRTDDLAATMRNVSADMPDRWLTLSINEGNVKIASFYGLMESVDAASPLSGPMVLESWLAATDGDASGLWLLNAAFMFFPDLVWGERAATGIIDASAVDAYYEAGGHSNTILGDAANDFSWAGGRLTSAWPAGPGHELYREVQPSDVETLLIGGTVDFSTPPVNATEELLPHLSNGQQIVLEDFGHTISFWTSQPDAWDRLINHYFDTGQVDDSLFESQAVDFTPESTHGAMARLLAGMLAGFALLLLVMLVWMPTHVRRSGDFGAASGAVLRGLIVPLIMGLGGFSFTWLALMTLWPAMPYNNQWATAISIGLPIGAGCYWASAHATWGTNLRQAGLWLALGGGVVGAWLGFHATGGLMALATALIGGAVGANLALIVLSIATDQNEPARDEESDYARALAGADHRS